MAKKDKKLKESKNIEVKNNDKKEENISDVEKKIEDNKNDNKKKKSIKTIIIIILSLIILLLASIVGVLLYRNSLENKTTGSDWSDKYYNYLKEQNKKKEVNDI